MTPKADAKEAVINDAEQQISNRKVEEKVEYRDQNGKIMNEEEVKALEGKVSFSTRYETRTRVLDADGKQLAEGLVEEESPVAAKPDGEEQATAKAPEDAAITKPAKNEIVNEDLHKELKINRGPKSGEMPLPEPPIAAPSEKNEL